MQSKEQHLTPHSIKLTIDLVLWILVMAPTNYTSLTPILSSKENTKDQITYFFNCCGILCGTMQLPIPCMFKFNYLVQTFVMHRYIRQISEL